MSDPSTLLAFALASAILIVSPGPTVLMTVMRSLSHGPGVAWPLAFGVGLGGLVATSLSRLGVGALLAASATAFTLVKWAGAAYLVWIAVGMWRSAGNLKLEPAHAPSADRSARRGAFREAFVVTVLNPKGIVFFVAFAPQFIDPARPYATQATTLIGIFTMIGFANVLAYAFMAGRARGLLRSPAVLANMTRGGAVALAAAGLATLFARRAA